MALVKCKECGNEMSTTAAACPKCGAKRKKPVGIVGVVVVAALAFFVYKMFSGASEITEARAAASVQEAAAWSYRDTTDAGSGAKGKAASISAAKQLSLKFPYQGPNQPVLTIRKQGASTDVLVSIAKGQIICPPLSCKVGVRFDDGKVEQFTGTMPTDHSSTTIFLAPEKKLIEKIKKAKTTTVVLTIFQEGDNALEFKTADLTW